MGIVANNIIVLRQAEDVDVYRDSASSIESEQKNNLRFFRRSSEETIDTLIVDRSSDYVADNVK